MAEIITVSALNAYVKSTLDSDINLRDVAVEGEVVNFKQYFPTGTCYFSLKDSRAAVKAVMFGNYARELGFAPENGMKVMVRGRVSLYEKDGAYQINVFAMFTAGQGAGRLAVRRLKEKLAAEGLFSPERKKKLPPYPFKIGVATSEKGAAIHDIISVAKRRFPCVTIVLAPCFVQGDGAEDSIVRAVQKLDESDVDLIIIGRGGGGNEHLGVYDSEKIARAVAACRKPTISAVGHETDNSVLDLVSDYRVATPTAAAEVALPDISDINMTMAGYRRFIIDGVPDRIDRLSERLENLSKSDGLLSVKDRIRSCSRYLEQAGMMISEKMRAGLIKRKGYLDTRAREIETLSPISVLQRGYALLLKDGKSAKDICFTPGDTAEILTFSQRLECEIKSASPRKE